MISVIIPSRNRFQYVKDLLGDLELQKMVVSEIIIVDQSDIPYEFSKSLNLIHITDNQHGPCRARNIGIEKSSGDICVFLDDDIRIGPEFIQQLCDPIIKMGYSVSTGAILNPQGEYKRPTPKNWRIPDKDWINSLTSDPGHPGTGISLSFAGGGSAIKREIITKIGLFDTYFDPNGAGEDREFALRLLNAGYPIFYNGQAKVVHLGAKTGGRNNTSGYYYEMVPLQANLIYIVAKYFSWQVFNTYCNDVIRSILKKTISFNPRSWFSAIKKISRARQWIHKIREIKIIERWE